MRSSAFLRRKVAVIGASSRVGQTLSLLLTLCPHVTEVRCCDSAGVKGLAVDLSHIDVPVHVASYSRSELEECVRGADIALCIFGSHPSATGKHGSALGGGETDTAAELALLAPAIHDVMGILAQPASRQAVVGVVAPNLNRVLPLCAALLQSHGHFDPRRLCGVTSHSVVRARTLVARELRLNPFDVIVPVVGGDTGRSRCILLTQTGLRIPHDRIVAIASALQTDLATEPDEPGATDAEDLNGPAALKVAQADVGEAARAAIAQHSGSVPNQLAGLEGHSQAPLLLSPLDAAPLSMAYAAQEWIVSVIKALRGDEGIVECTMVESTVVEGLPFFSSRVEFGPCGVQRIHPIGPLSPMEKHLVDQAVELMKGDVAISEKVARTVLPAR